MRTILAVSAIFIVAVASAQPAARKNRDVFPHFGNYERKGWIISPALTYTIRPVKNHSERLFINDSQTYDIEYRASGKLGLGVEVGRFYVIDSSPMVSYIDFALGIKNFRGVERFEAGTNIGSGNIASIRGDGVFSQNHLTASFNASKINQLSDLTFLQNTLGVNLDYRIGENIYYNDRGLPIELANTNPLLFQAHYRFGVGYKLSPNVLVIPSLETPILTLYEFDEFKSTLQVFNSRYRPIILRISILLLDAKKDRQCPTKGGGKRKKSESLFNGTNSKR